MTHWRLRWWLAFFSNQVIFKLGCEYFFRHNNVCILCCCCWAAQLCPNLCDPMNGSTPGLPIPHHLPELAQTHVHWVDDAIQPSHPLQSPFPPAFNLSQHQGLFQWVSSSHQVAKGLVLQHQFFQRIFSTDFLQNGLVWSPWSPRNSQESSPTPQFKSINSLAFSLLYRQQHGVNVTFICTGKPNKACLLYCGGLELKPQYL